MNCESLIATIVVCIGAVWIAGLICYFKGYKEGIKDTKEEIFKEEDDEQR